MCGLTHLNQTRIMGWWHFWLINLPYLEDII